MGETAAQNADKGKTGICRCKGTSGTEVAISVFHITHPTSSSNHHEGGTAGKANYLTIFLLKTPSYSIKEVRLFQPHNNTSDVDDVSEKR